MNASNLPTINASLNGLASIFLLLGYISIKNNKPLIHRKCMILALISSALFLTTYLTYHFMVPGPTKYQGTGIWRTVYFTVLLTHTPLATLIVPFCIMATIYAFRGNYVKHKKITRWLWPAWMYVSVTGVIIYLMLYVIK